MGIDTHNEEESDSQSEGETNEDAYNIDPTKDASNNTENEDVETETEFEIEDSGPNNEDIGPNSEGANESHNEESLMIYSPKKMTAVIP